MPLILSRRGLLITVSALAIGSPAFAQTAPAATQEASTLDEIVVTAQRRSQNMQEVPISVTAVTAEVLSNSGVSSTESLPALVPGLVMTRQSRGAQPYIRGVGSQNTVPGNENAVAAYVDGVYISDPGASMFSFNNIQRIEVLKGPQGTLFGRNATGGLISVITRTPTITPQLETSISYGSYDTVEGALYASGGRGDVAADLAVYAINQGEGFGKFLNIAGNPDANRREEWAMRSKVVWSPTENDTLTLAGDYRSATGDIGTSRNIYRGTIMAGGYTPSGSIQDATGTVLTQIPDSEDWGVSAHYRHDFGDIQLSILSAYRNGGYRMLYDQDVGPLFLSHLDQTQDNRTFQNEIMLNGLTGDLNWTVGFFHFSARSRFNPIMLRSGASPAGNTNLFSTQQTSSYAAFAQGTYEIRPGTNLTAGIRYTVDERDFYAEQFAAPGNTLALGTLVRSAFDQSEFKEPTWRLGIDQKLSERVLVYATYNRGFKSGVYNLVNPVAPPVSPETLDAFEIGLKSELLDRTMRLNIAAFRYDYKDIQLNSVQAGLTSLFNAAGGEVTGGEIEIAWSPRLPTGTLDVTANVSILDATYTDFLLGPITTPAPGGGNIGTFGDLSGNKMIRSPEWTANLSVSYSVPVAFGELGVTASYFHNDGFFWEADNRTHQDAYDVVNATVSATFGNQLQYRVRVFANNLTDEEYYTGVAENSFGDTSSAAPPRTIGIGFDYRY